MVDWTKPIQTKSGRAARVLTMDLFDPSHTVVVAVMGEKGDREHVFTYKNDGQYRANTATDADIVNVPSKWKLTDEELRVLKALYWGPYISTWLKDPDGFMSAEETEDSMLAYNVKAIIASRPSEQAD